MIYFPSIRHIAARIRMRAWDKFGDPKSADNKTQAQSQAMWETAQVLDDILDAIEKTHEPAKPETLGGQMAADIDRIKS